MPQFVNSGVALNYLDEGEARPLLLLHAGSARLQSFDALIPTLSARWRVLALDLRGHGLSSRRPGEYRLADFADDVCAFLRWIGEPAVIYGHSLGGMVAVLAASLEPGLVRGLVVGDAPLSAETWLDALSRSRDRLRSWQAIAGGRWSVEEIEAALRTSPVETPTGNVPMVHLLGEDHAYFGWMARNLLDHDPEFLRLLVEAPDILAFGYEMADMLPKIRCPVLLLQADPALDAVLSDEEVQSALKLLPDSTHTTLRGVGHPLHHTHPEEVLRVLTGFLDSLRS